jgi:VWFA-related protein
VAALAWVNLPGVPGRRVGVFRIDRGLEELQTFTEDRGPVIQALEDVARSAPTRSRNGEDREQLRELRQRLATVMSPTESSQSPFTREVTRRQLVVQISMIQATETLERDQQGLATTNALLALVNGLRTLPGRKAAVFFSEGLVLPDRVTSTLASVISEANRGGVSFYAADAAGLRVTSASEEARRDLASAAEQIEIARENGTGIGTRLPMTQMIERNEDRLRSDPASGLGTLARDTGGFLIHDTNDIAAGLRRVEEELGAYYLLSYQPKNEEWNGGYRRIEVRTRRGGLTLQARRGYHAVRTPMPTPLLEHEAPVVARLERDPQAAAVPLQVEALHFPAEDGDSLVSLVAELPGGALRLDPGPGAGTFVQDFTVLVLVRDADARVVHKASRRYALTWPRSKVEEVRRSRVLFEKDALLPPGRYTVEAVVYDARADAAGVARVVLEAPPGIAGALRLSSLVVVGHSEARATSRPAPLQYQGLRLYPSFGEAISVGAGKPLAFLFTVRPGDYPPSEAQVELLDASAEVRRADVPLSAPDAVGQVRAVGGLPIDGLAAGSYTLRLTLTDGRSLETRRVDVTLAP